MAVGLCRSFSSFCQQASKQQEGQPDSWAQLAHLPGIVWAGVQYRQIDQRHVRVFLIRIS